MLTFYTLIITQILSLIGSHMTGVAIGIQIYADTGDTAPLLIAAFFAEIPMTLGSSLTGVIADRFDRRYIIMIGDIGQALGTVLLLVSFASGQFQLWHLYVAMLVQGIFATVQTPASQAAMAMLVPPAQRDRANSIREFGFPLAGVVAPVFAGLLYSVAGIISVMVVDLITFFVAVAVVLVIYIPRPAQSVEAQQMTGGWWREALAGWRFLWQRRALFYLAMFISFVWFLINGPLGVNTPYIIATTGSEELLGLLLGAMNFGAFAGALVLALAGNIRHRVRIILLLFLLHGTMLLAWGIVRQPLLMGLTLIALMFPLPMIGALFATILQNKTPPDMQGRVFGASNQMGVLLTPLSFLITAVLVDNVLEPAATQPGEGMGLLMIVTGSIILVLTLIVFARPSIRSIERDLPDYVIEA